MNITIDDLLNHIKSYNPDKDTISARLHHTGI